MQISRNLTKTTAIAVSVLFIASAILVTFEVQPVQAQYTNMQEGGSAPLPAGVTPNLTLKSSAYLNFRPNPHFHI